MTKGMSKTGITLLILMVSPQIWTTCRFLLVLHPDQLSDEIKIQDKFVCYTLFCCACRYLPSFLKDQTTFSPSYLQTAGAGVSLGSPAIVHLRMSSPIGPPSSKCVGCAVQSAGSGKLLYSRLRRKVVLRSYIDGSAHCLFRMLALSWLDVTVIPFSLQSDAIPTVSFHLDLL